MTGPTSAELLAELVERGASLRAIGDAIGRDSSLLSQIKRGRKSGANLTDALVKLRDDLAGVSRTDAAAAARAASVPEPSRRRTGRGEVARVRRRTVYRGDGWTTGSVKAQASKSGARSLAPTVRNAARGGGNVVVTLTVAPHGKPIELVPQSPKARARAEKSGGRITVRRPTRLDMKVDADRLDQAIAAHGGNVTEAAWMLALEDGYLAGADADDASSHVDAVEVRTW